MLEQYDASSTQRFGQAKAISRKVSSLTHEQNDRSSDPSNGQDVAAERIPASDSLWQVDKSSSCN